MTLHKKTYHIDRVKKNVEVFQRSIKRFLYINIRVRQLQQPHANIFSFETIITNSTKKNYKKRCQSIVQIFLKMRKLKQEIILTLEMKYFS